jgi:hypothetical protein
MLKLNSYELRLNEGITAVHVTELFHVLTHNRNLC